MKIVIIGGRGTIGSKVSSKLSEDHEVLIAGRSEGYYKMDIADTASIQSFFEKIGKVDAIINIGGEAKWGPFSELSEEDYYIGIKSKLMGQVNLVRIGLNFLNVGGSVTLSTGILADHPVPLTASAAMVNGAIHSFVQAASLDIGDQCRLNVVSLGLVEDSAEKYAEYFQGHTPISMDRAVGAYLKSINSDVNGVVIREYP